MDDAGLGRERCGRDSRGRHGEVEHAVRAGEQQLDVGRERDPVGWKPGQNAGILADQRRAGLLGGARQHDARRIRNGAHNRAPHAPAGAHDDKPHVRHGSGLPILRAV